MAGSVAKSEGNKLIVFRFCGSALLTVRQRLGNIRETVLSGRGAIAASRKMAGDSTTSPSSLAILSGRALSDSDRHLLGSLDLKLSRHAEMATIQGQDVLSH